MRQIEIHDGTHESGAIYRAPRIADWAVYWLAAQARACCDESIHSQRGDEADCADCGASLSYAFATRRYNPDLYAAEAARIDAAEQRYYGCQPAARRLARDRAPEFPDDLDLAPGWYEDLAAAAEAIRD